MLMVRLCCCLCSCLLFLAACTGSPSTIPIHDEPALLVDVAYDPGAGSGHSHPPQITQAQVLAALNGLELQGRDVSGTLGILDHHQVSPAFVDKSASVLAPLLSEGFRKASPRDLVRFYLIQRDPQRGPLVTSGGMFVRNRHLYLILANGRTSPNSVQYENVYEVNPRLDPLLPIVRLKFKVSFIPPDWRVDTAKAKQLDGWGGYLDESKVIVLDLDRIVIGNGAARTLTDPVSAP